MGQYCRYDGQTNSEICSQLVKDRLLPVCPEQLGELPIPRPPAEITGGNGQDVLDGRACVKTKTGQDVTANFLLGARKVLAVARNHKITCAIFKERSPSCGSRYVYDGTFSGKLIKGCGVTTALLRKNDIEVFSEEDLLAFRDLRELIKLK